MQPHPAQPHHGTSCIRWHYAWQYEGLPCMRLHRAYHIIGCHAGLALIDRPPLCAASIFPRLASVCPHAGAAAPCCTHAPPAHAVQSVAVLGAPVTPPPALANGCSCARAREAFRAGALLAPTVETRNSCSCSVCGSPAAPCSSIAAVLALAGVAERTSAESCGRTHGCAAERCPRYVCWGVAAVRSIATARSYYRAADAAQGTKDSPCLELISLAVAPHLSFCHVEGIDEKAQAQGVSGIIRLLIGTLN